MNKDEFTARFTSHCLKECGFTHFDDGQSVADYCAEIAPTYFEDELHRSEGPEACAESDMSYWGEE